MFAISKGIQLAEELLITNYIMESDCASMVRKILYWKEDLSIYGHMISIVYRMCFLLILA